MSLALWLRTGRAERGLSLVDVARITKIQSRILERLEGGNLDGLPAEVFVRGFIRSFARCCGLDEAEALTRYGAAQQAQLIATAPAMPSALSAPPAARAMVDAMSDLAPQVARTTEPIPAIAVPSMSMSMSIDTAAGGGGGNGGNVEPIAELAAGSLEMVATEPVAPSSKKKKQRGKKRANRATQKNDRTRMATGTPVEPSPVVVESAPDVDDVVAAPVVAAPVVGAPVVVATQIVATSDVAAPVADAQAVAAPDVDAPVVEAAAVVDDVPVIVESIDPLVEPADANEDVIATPVWQPRMPAPTTTATVPWRRPAYVTTTTAAASVPTLVIDDADPDHAEQILEDREAAKSVLTNAQRRSFLPPILLDREDRSARQGGLTLAVIILLIAGALTLSYLMRRPSSSGDGVTSIDHETQLVG